MKKLGIGVIGCGIISDIHLNAIIKNENSKLVMVCDINASKAIEKSVRYNCKYSTNYNDLLNNEEIDIIHVLTPHFNHYEIAKKILLTNKHCLLEKPMTIKYKDALDLIDVAENNKDAKLGIVFQNRFNNTSIYIKKLIQTNKYGQLKGIKGLVTWNRDKEYYLHDDWRGKWETEGGGVLINQAIHTLDLIQLFGGEVESISGCYGTFILNDVIEVEDTATIYLNFKNKVRGILFASNNNLTNSPIEIELVFENAIILLIDSKLYLKNNHELCLLCEDLTSTGEKAYWGLGHETLINNFYESIINNNNNYINAIEGSKVINILENFYQFANKKINIKL